MAKSKTQTVPKPSSDASPKKKKTLTGKIFSKSTYSPVTNLFKSPSSSPANSRRPTLTRPNVAAELESKSLEAALIAELEAISPEEKVNVETPDNVEEETAGDEASAASVAAAEDVEFEVTEETEDVEVEVKETEAAEENLASHHDAVEPIASSSASHTPQEPCRLAQPGETANHQGVARPEPKFDLGSFIRNTVIPLLSCGMVPPQRGSRHGDY